MMHSSISKLPQRIKPDLMIGSAGAIESGRLLFLSSPFPLV